MLTTKQMTKTKCPSLCFNHHLQSVTAKLVVMITASWRMFHDLSWAVKRSQGFIWWRNVLMYWKFHLPCQRTGVHRLRITRGIYLVCVCMRTCMGGGGAAHNHHMLLSCQSNWQIHFIFSHYIGQTTVNKKAPIHYIISINDMVYGPL